MTLLTSSLSKYLLSWAVSTALLWSATNASAEQPEQARGFQNSHQIGLCLGVWNSRGETPPKSGSISELGTYETNIKNSAAFFEGYFGYRFCTRAILELSAGTVNRGSVTIAEGDATDIGNLVLYPVLVQLRLYPLPSPVLKTHPFVLAGGGLYYGRRSVQFTNAGSYYSNWEEESGTDFNYVIGGGVDWPVGGLVALEFLVKYMPISFSKTLLTIEDYDAIAFTMGVKYLYSP